MRLPILYQDRQIIAVNKPSGLLVHRTALDRFATENAMHLVRDQIGQWVYPVHRLDKATSGVLLFGLDPQTARMMTELFSRGELSKTYLAVVRGYTREAGSIDHPLQEGWDKMTDMNAVRDRPEKTAVTDYIRLATAEVPEPVGRYATARYSLIQASPLNGRRHQIRRHLKHIFHPVIGDTTYGDGKQNRFFRQRFNCRRLLLHASSIAFSHPAGGQAVRIEAPLDPAFTELLKALNWDGAVTGLSGGDDQAPSL